MQARSLLFVLTACLLVAACAGFPPADPQRSKRLRQEAQTHVVKHDYPAAAQLYGEATRYDPENTDNWLQWGDLLEATDEIDQAADVWSDALAMLPLSDPSRPMLTYRLGLLLADPLKQTAAARELCDQLPNGLLRSDLEAVLATAGNRPASALAILKQALPLATDTDQQARIYFHAAQAHARLGNINDSREMLFHAVNSATSPGLKMAIRTLFSELVNQTQN
jgi:tetratricopeptide (TPR) repeat protein